MTTTLDHPGHSPEAAKPRTRKWLTLGACGCLVTAALGWLVWSHGVETTDDAQVEADIVPISTRVSGSVWAVQVHDDQVVKKGELLLEIDRRDYEEKVHGAEAELAAASAQVSAADAQVAIVDASSRGNLSAARAALSGSSALVGGASAQISSAQANVLRAQADDDRIATDLKRAEALRKDEAVPQAQVDTLRANHAASAAAVAQAKAQLAVVQEMKVSAVTRVSESAARVAQTEPVEAQLAAVRANAELARAHVAGAEAALALARLQLSYTRVEAPIDGILSRVGVREGQLLQAGQQVVSVIPHATYLVANFQETQVSRVQPGQSVTVTLDGVPGRTLDGVVESKAAGTGSRFSVLPQDNASGNFVKVTQRIPIRIAWRTLPDDVQPTAGMSADVTVRVR